jgi:hypothetical protein
MEIVKLALTVAEYFKEFLDDLITEAFDPQAEGDTPTLFSVTEQETLAVNVELVPTQDILAHYEFLGRVLGKSMYESYLGRATVLLAILKSATWQTEFP